MPFLPIADENPRVIIAKPWVTWSLMALNFVMFWVQILSGQEGGLVLIYGLGVIPASLFGHGVLVDELFMLPPPLTLFTHMFLHGDFMHLAGNLLFLWVFGDNVEDSMGHRRFLLFYILCGVTAALFHAILQPFATVPMIGASGAISGILGAYLILHPRSRVYVPIVFIPIALPAWFLLLGWIGFQIFAAATDPGTAGQAVAWWAHIGGFLIGALLIVPLRYRSLPLFGADDLPSGITLRDRNRRRQPHRGTAPSRGPWG